MAWDLFDRFSAHGEKILQSTKLISIGASIIGAYYFSSYLRAHNIPFPLDLAVLPAILLAIGLASIVTTGIIIFYILMVGWAQTDPLDIRYAELIHTRPSGLIAESRRTALFNIAAIFILPFLIWVLFLFYTPKGFEDTSILILLGIYTAWSLLIGLIKGRERSHSNTRDYLIFSGKVSIFTFLISFFTVTSSLVYISILAPQGSLENELNILLAFCVFIFINTSVLYPYIRISTFNKENAIAMNSVESIKLDRLPNNIYGSFSGITGILLASVTLFPPFNAFIGELPLRFLGLSTTDLRVFHTSKSIADSWPDTLLDKCENGRCTSTHMTVVIDFGKTIYVRLPNKRDRIFRLQRAGIIDEIRQP